MNLSANGMAADFLKLPFPERNKPDAAGAIAREMFFEANPVTDTRLRPCRHTRPAGPRTSCPCRRTGYLPPRTSWPLPTYATCVVMARSMGADFRCG